eukprot:NODE_1383_length_1526_cov_243.424589_g1310_i0.p1 GENE.NODE_1383_length_1526_cov_243.424589_g1310_i0~~NODE_1383_length_1526_cov_243.424589_g1310_i0.p1  ORF type:complete len:484 (+),score=69.51 NODE_1383_length_1526_cov_243.424589_g1310_i0:55-1452(+)
MWLLLWLSCVFASSNKLLDPKNFNKFLSQQAQNQNPCGPLVMRYMANCDFKPKPLLNSFCSPIANQALCCQSGCRWKDAQCHDRLSLFERKQELQGQCTMCRMFMSNQTNVMQAQECAKQMGLEDAMHYSLGEFQAGCTNLDCGAGLDAMDDKCLPKYQEKEASCSPCGKQRVETYIAVSKMTPKIAEMTRLGTEIECTRFGPSLCPRCVGGNGTGNSDGGWGSPRCEAQFCGDICTRKIMMLELRYWQMSANHSRPDILHHANQQLHGCSSDKQGMNCMMKVSQAFTPIMPPSFNASNPDPRQLINYRCHDLELAANMTKCCLGTFFEILKTVSPHEYAAYSGWATSCGLKPKKACRLNRAKIGITYPLDYPFKRIRGRGKARTARRELLTKIGTDAIEKQAGCIGCIRKFKLRKGKRGKIDVKFILRMPNRKWALAIREDLLNDGAEQIEHEVMGAIKRSDKL